MTIMLVIVSTYSFVTTFPRLVAVAMNSMNNPAKSLSDFLYHQWAIKIIAPWNYCGNFFFYVLSGRQFREELVLMFCCRKRPPGTVVFSCVSHRCAFLIKRVNRVRLLKSSGFACKLLHASVILPQKKYLSKSTRLQWGIGIVCKHDFVCQWSG